MANMNSNCPAVLIDGNGNFNENIQHYLNLASENCPIAALSVLGVQSTGKSTLLNECFSSGFQVMDASQGIHQTTKGIWIAKWASSSNCPHKILVIDTEGSDGSERGGDNRFEKQASLFALAISNTVIFNMKFDNVNLHNGASLPLLQTVFEVMVRKFNTPRKINLLFVLRDKNPQSPLEALKEQLLKGIREIWREIKPQAQGNGANASLEAYFNMEVMAMSHYYFQKEQFIREVGILRQWIISYSTSGRLGIADLGFLDYAKIIWDDIKEDRILNLQLNRINITEVFCHRIAEKNNQNFRENESWLQIEREVESRVRVEGFGNNVSSLIDNFLSEYDNETQGLDTIKRGEIRQQLTEKLVKMLLLDRQTGITDL